MSGVAYTAAVYATPDIAYTAAVYPITSLMECTRDLCMLNPLALATSSVVDTR